MDFAMERDGADKSKSEIDAGSMFSDFFGNAKPKNIRQLPCGRDDIGYNMKHPQRGRCLILNYKVFDMDLNTREGTDKDVESLESTFKGLKFSVETYHNLTLLKTKDVLYKESKRNFNDYDCLVVCILTHGTQGLLYCKDKEFYTEELFEYFTANNCEGLVGKPKLFFIQACQGEKFDAGTVVHDSYNTPSGTIRIPNYADILVFYSTYPGHFSWRNIKDGSWFIQTLCKVLRQHSGELDLVSMLTVATKNVAYGYQSNVPNRPDMDQKKQVPCIMSTLTRLVFFD